MTSNFTLLIHGGAGDLANTSTDKKEAYRKSLNRILETGRALLAEGKSSLDVVEKCVILLENDPLYNAGKGSVLNEDGEIEMDAAIMTGDSMKAGSVAGVKGVRNPIVLARAVVERSEHVMLIGEGALKFAKAQGFTLEPREYFLTEFRVKQWEDVKSVGKVVLDHSSVSSRAEDKKMGTVGAVAFDKKGGVAAATSTGGIVNKKYGRVGDSPIIGAGVYAENGIGAISATGYGEQFIRTVLAKHVADIIRYKSVSAQEAAEAGIKYLVEKVKGLGGVIVVDGRGGRGVSFSTPDMIFAAVTEGQDTELGL